MARNAGETEWWCTQSRAQSGRLSRLIRLKSCGREWHCWSRLASLHACGLESNVWHRLAGSNSNPGKSKPPNPRRGCHDANPLASWAASWGAFPKAYPKSQGKKITRYLIGQSRPGNEPLDRAPAAFLGCLEMLAGGLARGWRGRSDAAAYAPGMRSPPGVSA